MPKQFATPARLKSYPLPKPGAILLACGKCQRKLKKGHDPEDLRSFKKLLKQQAKTSPLPVKLRVLRVPCLKMCPKGGIAVMTAGQIARHECSIVRSSGEIESLYAACAAEQMA